MKKIKNRAISGILALVMVLSMFIGMPVTASAAGTEYKIGGPTNLGSGWYPGLDELLTAKTLEDGDTITLFGAVEYNSKLTITAEVTINLSGFNLLISSPEKAIYICDGGSLTITGPGDLTAAGSGIGLHEATVYLSGGGISLVSGASLFAIGGHTAVYADNGAVATVTKADGAQYGVYADGSGTSVTVDGNVEATAAGGEGVVAISAASVSVSGGVTGKKYGVRAKDTGTIASVIGSVEATEAGSYGVYASGGAKVSSGNTSGKHCGIYATGEGASVTATGNSVADEAESYGACAFEGAEVTVYGNASGSKYGVRACNEHSSVIVGSDATGGIYGVYANLAASVSVGNDATGGAYGVFAEDAGTIVSVDGGAVAMTASGNEYLNSGVCAKNDSKVTIEKNVEGGDCGIEVRSGAEATVNGNVMGSRYGVLVLGIESKAYVGRDVTVTGPEGFSVYSGAKGDACEVTVGGEISGNTYIVVNDKIKTINQFESVSGKPGYLEYKNGKCFVWVLEKDPDLFQIGNAKYKTFSEALTEIPDKTQTTVKVLRDVTVREEPVIVNKNIIFDLNGKDLTFANKSDSIEEFPFAVMLENSSVDYKGKGSLTVLADFPESGGVNVEKGVNSIRLTKIEVSGGYYSWAAWSYDGGILTVTGDIAGVSDTEDYLVWAQGGGSLTINGDIYSIDNKICSGAAAENGGKITVNGNINVSEIAVSSANIGPEITVNGNVTGGGVTGINEFVVIAKGGGIIEIAGSVTASGVIPLICVEGTGTSVKVGGRVERADSGSYIGIVNSGGRLVLNGPLPNPAHADISGTMKLLDEAGADDPRDAEASQEYMTYTIGTPSSSVWVKRQANIPYRELSVYPAHAILQFSGDYVTFTAALSSGKVDVTKINWSYKTEEAGSNGITPSAATGSMTYSLSLSPPINQAYFTVTAEYDDDGVTYTATATVEILPGGIDSGTTVELLETKGTINKAKTVGALIPVLITNRVMNPMGETDLKPYKGAVDFTVNLNGKDADKFTASMYNDRYLEIKAKEGTKNGSYKNIEVEINGQPAGKITLTVTEKYPKITLKAGQLNLAYPEMTVPITAISPDGECTIISVEPAKSVDTGRIVFENGALKLGAGAKKATVSSVIKITVAGYKTAYKNPPKLNIKIVDMLPKIKAEKSTLTLTTTASELGPSEYVSPGEIKLLSSDSKNPVDWDKVDYVYLDNGNVDVYAAGGKVNIPANTAAGSHILKVKFSYAARPVEVKITVKSLSRDKITISSPAKSIVINKSSAESELGFIYITPSVSNLGIKDFEIKGELPEGIKFKTDYNMLVLEKDAAPLEGTDKPVVIEINSASWNFKKPIKITLSVTDMPLKGSVSQKGKLDIANPGSFVTATLKIDGRPANVKAVTLDDGNFKAEFPNPADKSVFAIKAESGKYPVPGVKYSVKVTATLANEDVFEKTIIITPVQGTGKAAQSLKNLTLYKLTPYTGEEITLTLTKPSGAEIGDVVINENSIAALKLKEGDFKLERSGENTWVLKLDGEPIGSNGKTKTSCTVKLDIWMKGTYEPKSGTDGRFKAPLYAEINGKQVQKSKPVTVSVKVSVK